MAIALGTILAGAAASAAAGAASKGIGSLIQGGPDKANVLGPTADQLEKDRQASLSGLAGQQQFAQGLQGAGQQGVNAQQMLLAALQQQAMGQGVSPAQQALANATGANVANQAALLAGNRGASSNAGLIGRQAAMQGAGAMQQAAGQAAELRANEQLAAQGQLGALGTQLVNQQGAALGNVSQTAQGLQGMGLQAAQGANQTNLGNANQANQFNAPFSNAIAGKVGDGIFQSVSQGALNSAFPPKKMSEGGEVPGKALVEGDHEANDTVPTLLSPGEIVIPRSYASDPKAAAAFAHACAMFNGGNDE
jgi:hypothetical protein